MTWPPPPGQPGGRWADRVGTRRPPSHRAKLFSPHTETRLNARCFVCLAHPGWGQEGRSQCLACKQMSSSKLSIPKSHSLFPKIPWENPPVQVPFKGTIFIHCLSFSEGRSNVRPSTAEASTRGALQRRPALRGHSHPPWVLVFRVLSILFVWQNTWSVQREGKH